MAQIPMTADVAAVIGTYGERIQNRSLLLDKFVFHKSWPVAYEESGKTVEALAKPPRDMGVPPMKHGQDARATPARKGFCRIF